MSATVTVFGSIFWLAMLVAVMAAMAAGAGLFSRWTGESYPYETARGQEVMIHGRGLYRFDSVFFAAGFKGQDAVVLFLGLPVLVLAALWYRNGSFTGQLVLLGALGYFLYLYASMALGAAYNRLFLLYVAIASASLFAFVPLFASVNLDVMAALLDEGLPRMSLAIFMLASGMVTLIVWGMPLVVALSRNAAPDKMDHYTTMVTYALDLAIITPAAFLSGFMVLQENALGYVAAVPLLALVILLAPQIILSTVFQKGAGVPFSPGEMIGPVAGFALLGLLALALLVDILAAAEAVLEVGWRLGGGFFR